MHHHHHPLGKWQLDEGGLRLRLDRRTLVRSALGAGAAAAAFGGTNSAKALTQEQLPPALIGAIPPRKGVLAWSSLAQVKAPLGEKPQFPAEVARLNGNPVVVEGHMMPLGDSDPVQRFLLTAYQAHCPYCMPAVLPRSSPFMPSVHCP